MPTVVNWIKANRLKAHKTPGGHRRIAREDLILFLRKYEMPIPKELVRSPKADPKILAVDDDPDERELLQNLLEAAGFEVTVASNGFEAGLLFGSVRPDLVVMDLRMPDMDGYGAIELLRSRPETAGTPVVACTGMADEETRERVVESGFDAHVIKPYAPEDLVGVINDLLGISRRHTASAR